MKYIGDAGNMMAKRRTYLDANILIAAWSGDGQTRQWARAVPDDPNRIFVTSDFVRLEVLPKPGYYGKTTEIAFMEAILGVAENVAVSQSLVRRALVMASLHDLAPLDALHLAAAEYAADELITLEGSDKPMCRQKEVTVVSLRVLREKERS